MSNRGQKGASAAPWGRSIIRPTQYSTGFVGASGDTVNRCHSVGLNARASADPLVLSRKWSSAACKPASPSSAFALDTFRGLTFAFSDSNESTPSSSLVEFTLLAIDGAPDEPPSFASMRPGSFSILSHVPFFFVHEMAACSSFCASNEIWLFFPSGPPALSRLEVLDELLSGRTEKPGCVNDEVMEFPEASEDGARWLFCLRVPALPGATRPPLNPPASSTRSALNSRCALVIFVPCPNPLVPVRRHSQLGALVDPGLAGELSTAPSHSSSTISLNRTTRGHSHTIPVSSAAWSPSHSNPRSSHPSCNFFDPYTRAVPPLSLIPDPMSM